MPKTWRGFRKSATGTTADLCFTYNRLSAHTKALHKNGKRMIPLRLELRTACVLDRSDNQLHHRTNLMEELLRLAIIDMSSMIKCRSEYHHQTENSAMQAWAQVVVENSQQSRMFSRMCTAGTGEVSAVLTHPSAYSTVPSQRSPNDTHDDGMIERYKMDPAVVT
jgi:hypothetical protein